MVKSFQRSNCTNGKLRRESRFVRFRQMMRHAPRKELWYYVVCKTERKKEAF